MNTTHPLVPSKINIPPCHECRLSPFYTLSFSFYAFKIFINSYTHSTAYRKTNTHLHTSEIYFFYSIYARNLNSRTDGWDIPWGGWWSHNYFQAPFRHINRHVAARWCLFITNIRHRLYLSAPFAPQNRNNRNHNDNNGGGENRINSGYPPAALQYLF